MAAAGFSAQSRRLHCPRPGEGPRARCGSARGGGEVDRGGISAGRSGARCNREGRDRCIMESPPDEAALQSVFADISIWQLALVSGVALFASIVGGVTGYGSSALMPLVLVPLIGASPVVPIVTISSLFNNGSRA